MKPFEMNYGDQERHKWATSIEAGRAAVAAISIAERFEQTGDTQVFRLLATA
jgi:hypothetical protein